MTTLFVLEGAAPGTSTNWTVAPARKPVPVIVIGVPPVIGPVMGLMPVTVGTVGDQTQLFVTMLVPQYTWHWNVGSEEAGALTDPLG